MAIDWKTATEQEHNAIPKRGGSKPDPAWQSLMAELASGTTVQIKYSDDKERGTLARSVGRRAAHMGFKADIRYGDGFLSVRRVAVESEAPKRRRTRSRESDEEGQLVGES